MMQEDLMRTIRVVVLFAALALVHGSPGEGAVIWSFQNSNAAATPVSGFIAFDVASATAGTLWTLPDIVDFSFIYDGVEVASFAAPGLATFFPDAAGLNILEFTNDAPVLAVRLDRYREFS
jgi:hypothetical protein